MIRVVQDNLYQVKKHMYKKKKEKKVSLKARKVPVQNFWPFSFSC